MQNSFCESFYGRMRDELLNETLFLSLAHARVEIAAGVDDYNQERPHTSLGWKTPDEGRRLTLNPDAKPGDRQRQPLLPLLDDRKVRFNPAGINFDSPFLKGGEKFFSKSHL